MSQSKQIGILLNKRTDDDDEGWALTFADMMTILLCFFIIILSVSEVDPVRYDAVSSTLEKAMNAPAEKEKPKPKTVIPFDFTNSEVERLDIIEALKSANLGNNAAFREAVSLKMLEDSILITLKGVTFFTSGRAQLTDQANEVLQMLSPSIIAENIKITVEGHSDNVPINTRQFPSNWELSSARASAVARYLISKGAKKTNISVVGFSDTKPVAPHKDLSGRDILANRNLNRRIEIYVKP